MLYRRLTFGWLVGWSRGGWHKERCYERQECLHFEVPVIRWPTRWWQECITGNEDAERKKALFLPAEGIQEETRPGGPYLAIERCRPMGILRVIRRKRPPRRRESSGPLDRSF